MNKLKKTILNILMIGLIGISSKFCYDFYIGMSLKLAIIFIIIEAFSVIAFSAGIKMLKNRNPFGIIFVLIWLFAVACSVVSISGNYYNISENARSKSIIKIENKLYIDLQKDIKEIELKTAAKKEELRRLEESEQKEISATNPNFTIALTAIRNNYLKLKESKNTDIGKFEQMVADKKNELQKTPNVIIDSGKTSEGNNLFFEQLSKIANIDINKLTFGFAVLSSIFFNLIIICIKITAESIKMQDPKQNIAIQKDSSITSKKSISKKSISNKKVSQKSINRNKKVSDEKSITSKSITSKSINENKVSQNEVSESKVSIENKKVSPKRLSQQDISLIMEYYYNKREELIKSGSEKVRDIDIMPKLIERFGISEVSFKRYKKQYSQLENVKINDESIN